MRKTKCFDKNVHVKVEGENSDVDSSGRNNDHLSYSYSCVKSFRKNQHIIGDLATLHNQQEYQGITHQPALYSLSGERNRPICQPFYCSTVSENSNNSEEEYEYNFTQKQRVEEKKESLTKSESQQQFPVKSMLLQWLKLQFKQVNSLWSFTIPKDIFIPKFCKKNQKMKMEMTLNGIDEETKHRLMDYINKLNLGFEEHCNLCNETVLEVDVTSILDNPQRLQTFLTFLNSIEPEQSKRNIISDLNENNNKTSPQENNIIRKTYLKEKPDYSNKICGKSTALEKNTHQTYSLSVKSSESQESFIIKPKKSQNYQICEEINIIQPKGEKVATKRNTNNQIGKTEVKTTLPDCNKCKEILQGKKRVRKISTLSGINYLQHFPDQSKNTFIKNNKLAEQKNVHVEQNLPVFNVQTNIVNNNKASQLLNKVNRELSCKCLMHKNREDYYRYKNLCLFGKGDEINNSLIKYLNEREEKSDSSLTVYENQINTVPIKIYGDKNIDTLKTCDANERQINKINVRNDITENTGSFNHTTDKGIFLEDNLYPQVQSLNYVKQPCSYEYISLSTDNDNLKITDTKICGKSISYFHDSLPNINTSDESTARNNTLGSNEASLSDKYKACNLLHGEGSVLAFYEPTDQNCKTIGIGITTQNTLKNSCNCNIDYGIEQYSSVKARDLSESTMIKESYLENVKCKVNLVVNNGTESQKCNYDQSNAIHRVGVEDNSKLHTLLSKMSSEHETVNRSNSGAPCIYDDKKYTYPRNNEKKCRIFGCDCGKSEKSRLKSAKIKTIVFKIGTSNKEVKTCSIQSSKKTKSKFKTSKAKEVCKKISSVFKGSQSLHNNKCPDITRNNSNKTTNCSSIREKSFTNKSESLSHSWVNCEDYSSFIDSFTSRSKGTTQTCTRTSADLESSSLVSNDLGILLSELKSQRMEIDYMKRLLSNQVKGQS